MSSGDSGFVFDHFENTRNHKWTIIGVVGEDALSLDVTSVEIFAPASLEPAFTVSVSDLPQFIAGLTAAALPGDLTAVN